MHATSRGYKVLALLALTAAGAMASAPALADKVYKWVDEAGVTHYGTQPPKTASATKVPIVDTTSSDADAEIERLEKSRQAQRSAQGEEKAAAGGARGEEPGAQGGQPDANSQACESHRKNLAALKSGKRVRMTGEDGKPRMLGPEELKKQTEFAENELARCEQIDGIKAARDSDMSGKKTY